MPESFYDLLGIDEDATTEEIKRAYRGKVRRYHPDVNPDERATEQFRAVKVAYETLRDDERRAAYDRLGHRAFVQQRLGGRDVGDLVDWSGGAGAGERPAAGGTDDADASATARASSESGQSATTAGGTQQTVTTRGETATGGTPSSGAASRSAPSETASRTAKNEAATGGPTQSGRGQSGNGRVEDEARRRHHDRGGTIDGSDTRSERERAQVRRRIRRRKIVSRYGEPVLAGATLLSFLSYVIGISQYVGANRAGVDRAISAVPAVPDEGMAALETGGVRTGLEFAAESITAASPGTAFPVAAGVLPIALFATVLRLPARWRNPGWWLLPVAGSGPAVGLAVQYAEPGAVGASAVAVVGFLAAPAVAGAAWIALILSRL